MILDIESPINVGDKIWLSKNDGFGTCNFLERYKQYQEYRVKWVKLEYNLETNIAEWYYGVEGKSPTYKYTGKVARTKEDLYESFREEIEELIPEDLRNYLWQK